MPVTITFDNETIEVPRIFCIGRNYAAHAAELGSELGAEPALFMKPPTAIVPQARPIRLPRDRGAIHHEAEIVLLVGRDGAGSANDILGIAPGLDLTLRQVQDGLKEKRLPWELAKAFDDSAPLGEFVRAPVDFERITFECRVNGEPRQRGDMRKLLHPVPQLMKFLSSRFHLRRGDLVFTGTPEGVGPLAPGDVVEVFSETAGNARWHCE